jgi:hypothetical protein
MDTTTAIRLIIGIILASLLTACTTTTNEPIPDRLLLTAAADTVTTHIGIANGAYEMNPLGPNGVLVAKLAYIFGIRNYLNASDQARADHIFGSVWLGAAVNNVMVMVFPASAVAPIVLGIGAGYWSYTTDPSK